ncbi:Rho GTPase-activating protein gacA [Artemisia annua]|uniref:Rho GTPase-activating protein gacA n=1 Tax=Artemisia annua TaxID=35608 RepID=A0A2U1PSD1_ARTAN|nr:Rho GTPase-activating protein gacA [Artemisia annua]
MVKWSWTSALVSAGSQPPHSCQVLHLPARLSSMELAHHAVQLAADLSKREMVLDATVVIEGVAKVAWWGHKFKVHVESHITVDPVFLDVVDQENKSDLELFHGFLGLPVEFQPHVPRKAPSARYSNNLGNCSNFSWCEYGKNFVRMMICLQRKNDKQHKCLMLSCYFNRSLVSFCSTTVFGVSAESMQVSYDSRGNCVPTILLLLQHHLYRQGGLQAEGIFRISADNSQEEHLRSQLNHGVVPDGIDVHCLASLIKAWFRELPTGVLDHLSRNQLMQCRSEEECLGLVRLLPPMETALLDWLINLMADVVQHEQFNKMVTHNIAMVFAPNMTQMTDPLTALMYVGQVIKFLKTLILKTLRERGGSVTKPSSVPQVEML